MLDRTLARRLAAEFVGTFALVFAGCGAIMVDAKTARARPRRRRDHLRARDHGDDLRGRAHLRRALQPGRHASRSRSAATSPGRARSPTGPRSSLGALAAAAILRGSLGNIAHVGATLPSGSQGQSFLWELVLSFFLMFVIMAVATDTRAVGEAAAIAIGGTVGLDAMFGGPISGASMNPARSVGPAIVSGDLHALWLYILAPILGASLAALTYQFIRDEPTARRRRSEHNRARGERGAREGARLTRSSDRRRQRRRHQRCPPRPRARPGRRGRRSCSRTATRTSRSAGSRTSSPAMSRTGVTSRTARLGDLEQAGIELLLDTVARRIDSPGTQLVTAGADGREDSDRLRQADRRDRRRRP